jgi:YidC/Oxa1 family membrane protein insertase
MANDKRLILFIVLSGIILFGYNMLFPSKKTVQTQIPAAQSTSPAGTSVTAPAATAPASGDFKNVPAVFKNVPEKTFVMENSLVKITFSSFGAVMNSYKLKKYSDAALNKEKTELELIPAPSSYSYMSLSSPGFALDSAGWASSGVTEKDGKKIIAFASSAIKGITVIKEFSLEADSYITNIKLYFKNNTASPVAVKELQFLWGPSVHLLPSDIEKNKDSFNKYQKIHYPLTGENMKAYQVNLKAKENKLTILPETPAWIVIRDLYFLSSFILKEPAGIRNVFYKENTGGFAYIGVNLNDIILPANGEESVSIDSYTGPQEYKRLVKMKMQNVVDLGWIRILGVWMFYTMDFIYKITKNYGIAILLLTLLVRLILWYPSQKSYKQMKETQSKMKIVQPRLETLKKIYKEDAQKLNEETMKLYKEYGINPFGGCLPMLLQIPIFIALYQTLISMVELKGAYFFGWLTDLSKPDPFYILPVFMGVSMIIQQMMSKPVSMTPEAETQQKMMMWGMPIFLTYMALSWPSGLLLYWGMSNVLAIVQQYFVNKSK